VGGAKGDLVSGPPGEGPKVASEVGLAPVSADRTGWFRFYFDDQGWEWSEEVQRLLPDVLAPPGLAIGAGG
jgi:hypothetical protein